MKSSRRLSRVVLAGVLALAAAAPPSTGQEVDPFYTRLLEDGIRSLDRGDHSRAGEELRIAAFGLMESPPTLARALTHLALAQSAGGNVEGFEATLRRLSELEERFGAYADAELAESTRSELDRTARELLTLEALADSPIVAPEAAEVADSPSSERATLCISWTADGDCRQPGARAALPSAADPDLSADPASDPERAEATGPDERQAALPSIAAPIDAAEPDGAPAIGPSEEERAELERLSRLAAGRRSARRLDRSFAEARALADLYPEWQEAQRVTGLLAARTASYPEAVAYYRRSGEPSDEEPVELFYLSVALFETEEREAAAEALRRALPGLEQSPEVRRYVRLILPEETQS